MKKPSIEKVYEDLRASYRYLSKTFNQIKIDFEFALGKQWKEEDVTKLDKAGVKALTINKIRPLIKLITGIERQSRSDVTAFPEGSEDELLSEISTRLIKNVSKVSRLKNKQSEVFKDGVIGGACYIEPYLDYVDDLINGELKFRKIEAKRILFDPNSEEYDLSDGKYLIKLTFGLSEDDLLDLFPNDKKNIEKIGKGNIDLTSVNDDIDKKQVLDYPSFNGDVEDIKPIEKTYDLIEYYYKSPINIYYVVSQSQGIMIQTENKQEAEQTIAISGVIDAKIITKRAYEIRLKQVVGDVEFSDERSPSYPKWKRYPIVPFFAERITFDTKETDLLIQGIVRSIKDLQEEYNKRRTQELKHLNSSMNSGNIIPKGVLDLQNMNKLREYGSSPGVILEYDPERAAGTTPASWKVNPTPLSQGHAQLAAENAQDIKEAGGVNPDLLANDSQSQSGRAILLKQRQGLVMIQEPLDNYSQTKEILGRFILSQLDEVYTIETAMRVLGENFLKDNFKKPVFDMAGNPVVEGNSLKTEFDEDLARMTINRVLNDASMGKYDVTIGEGAYNETIQMANFMTLNEMAKSGIPVPPDVIVEESALSSGQKEKIKKSIDQMRMAAQPQPQSQPQVAQ